MSKEKAIELLEKWKYFGKTCFPEFYEGGYDNG